MIFAGTRFIPFKTPLDPKYDHDVPPEYRFSIPDLMDHCKDLNVCADTHLIKDRRVYVRERY